MKIFKMNDCDWVAAKTMYEAVAFYKSETGITEDDELNPRELTDEEMDRLKHLGVDHERISWPKDRIPSFRQELDSDIANGLKFPCLFASTEY